MEDALQDYCDYAASLPTWTLGEEAQEIAQASYNMPDDAVVVEIGAFLGAGTVLLAGARKLRGSGIVHTVDPFDGSGDAFSKPVYETILAENAELTARQHFDQAIEGAELADWVVAHQGLAHEVAATWDTPIDLLFLDADMSPKGARRIFESWAPFLKVGGWIAIHNSDEREYDPEHEGNRLIVVEELLEPNWSGLETVHSLTFAQKMR